MLVLNASGIILGDKRVNNWFEREIEKYRTKIRTSLLKIIFLYPTLWESRNNDDISCQIIWILLSLITNQAWLCLTLSLSSLTVYTSFNKRQCVVCSGLFYPFQMICSVFYWNLYWMKWPAAAGLLSPGSNIRKLNHVVINDPGSSALQKEI